MKVIMLCDNPLVSDARIEKQARSLAESSFEVVVFAKSKDSLEQFEERDGYQIVRCVSHACLMPFRRGYTSALKFLSDQILDTGTSHVHVHDYKLTVLIPKLKAAKPSLIITYDSHEYLKGWPFFKEIKNPLNRIKGFLVWKRFIQCEAQAIKHCDLVIAPSEAILQRQQENHPGLGLVVRNIPVMNEQVDVSNINLDNNGRLRLFMSGSIYMPSDFLWKLIDYVENSQHYSLYISGDRAIHLQLEKQCIGKLHIQFLPYDPSLVLSYAKQMDIGIAYTNAEVYEAHKIGSSNRIMEYSLAGIPILGTEQDSHTEFSERYGHIVQFKSSNFESFVHGLNLMSNNIDSYRSKAHSISDLNWENEFRPVVEFYKSYNKS